MTRTKYFAEVESSARRKIASRLLPYLFFLYLISYLDRMNISAAALQLPVDLGFSDHVIGLGAGIFFVGYLLLDLPGALIVERWGARAWIARIMISWGVITVLSAFIQTANQFFTARFLLGLAEAGFVPGIMVHLTHWFVDEDRGKAVARFMAASPVAYVVGSPLAGLILMTRWWGWHGWQWLFVLEGIPAIVLGVVTAFFLTDWPAQAHWLSPKEQDWIRGALDTEKSARAAQGSFTVVKALRDPDVILMAVSGFFVNVGIIGFGFWLPTMVKRFSGLSDFWSATLAALPYVAAFFAMHLILLR
jgi:ACS family tartrate transporter-like MFS transporter